MNVMNASNQPPARALTIKHVTEPPLGDLEDLGPAPLSKTVREPQGACGS